MLNIGFARLMFDVRCSMFAVRGSRFAVYWNQYNRLCRSPDYGHQLRNSSKRLRMSFLEIRNVSTTTCDLSKLLGDNKLPILRRHCFHRLMIFWMVQPGQADMGRIIDLAQQREQITPLV